MIRTKITNYKLIEGFDEKGVKISANQFLADLKEAERQIENGDFLTLEELKKESD